jgi:hypothetical protein
MDGNTIGYILGGAAVVLLAAFKVWDTLATSRRDRAHREGCPVFADPEVKAILADLAKTPNDNKTLLAKLVDQQSTLTQLTTRLVDVQRASEEILRELHTDHKVQDRRLDELREMVRER